MSMNGSFCAITATLHARLRRDPAMMKRLVSASGGLSDDVMANLLATAPAAVREQIREQLLAHKAMDAAPDIDPADLGARVDIDKAWHAVHFLVAASAYDVRPGDVATTFMLGGEECGDDVGYGPARMHGPDAVAAIAEALPEAIALRSRFDPGARAAALFDDDAADLRASVQD